MVILTVILALAGFGVWKVTRPSHDEVLRGRYQVGDSYTMSCSTWESIDGYVQWENTNQDISFCSVEEGTGGIAASGPITDTVTGYSSGHRVVASVAKATRSASSAGLSTTNAPTAVQPTVQGGNNGSSVLVATTFQGSNLAYKPAKIDFFADAPVVRIVWARWTNVEAIGTGTALGPNSRYTVTLTYTKPIACAGHRVFSVAADQQPGGKRYTNPAEMPPQCNWIAQRGLPSDPARRAARRAMLTDVALMTRRPGGMLWQRYCGAGTRTPTT